MCGMKLETGEVATDWSPSPYDIQSSGSADDGKYLPLTGGSLSDALEIKISDTVDKPFLKLVNLNSSSTSSKALISFNYGSTGNIQ